LLIGCIITLEGNNTNMLPEETCDYSVWNNRRKWRQIVVMGQGQHSSVFMTEAEQW